MSAAFAITRAAETEDVELRLSVAPDFSDALRQIEVAPLAGPPQVIGPSAECPDFVRLRIASGQKREIRLKDASGQVLGAASLREQPPVAFKTLPDADAITDQRNRPVVMERAGRSPTAELSLSGGGGTAGVAHLTDAAGRVRRLSLGSGARTVLTPGPHRVTLSRPDCSPTAPCLRPSL